MTEYDWHEITTQQELARGERHFIRGLERTTVPTVEEKTGKKRIPGLGIEEFDTKQILSIQLADEILHLEGWEAHEDGITGSYTDSVTKEKVRTLVYWEVIRVVMQRFPEAVAK